MIVFDTDQASSLGCSHMSTQAIGTRFVYAWHEKDTLFYTLSLAFFVLLCCFPSYCSFLAEIHLEALISLRPIQSFWSGILGSIEADSSVLLLNTMCSLHLFETCMVLVCIDT